MAKGTIRQEDVAGLTLAIAAHAALAAWILFGPKAPAPPPVEKVTVTLDGIVAPEAGSPSREQARVATAPELAPEPAPPIAAAPPPAPVPSPVPAPLPKAVPSPPQRSAPQRPTPPRPQRQQVQNQEVGGDFLKGMTAPNPKKAGGGRIGKDFLPGAASGSVTGKAATPPGPAITPELRISFAQAVLRQVKPNWQGRVPQGVNTDKIVSIISVELLPDGSLAREPQLLRQEGVDESNRAQAQRHAEEAIRAIKLSAPFRLPADAYEGWKKLPPLRFRKGS